jgi:DNA polymerase I-like protein with 3'-5' exonuclease and polymerase domains
MLQERRLAQMERQGVRITPDDFEKHMLQLEEEVRSIPCVQGWP